ASPGDLHRLEDSWDIGEGFPDVGLAFTSTKNPEQEEFGGFLGLPKESFNNNFDPFGDRNLVSRPLAAKISSLRPAILPSNSLNGQTPPLTMASRGRRGGASAREDEQRHEEQAEQWALAPQGPVLPPPPPVDYGVFMQGLVQAMQTQAHTQTALQAQLEAQERADVWWASLLRTRFEDGAIDMAWDEFASQKRLAATFQRQDKKKAVYLAPQHPVTTSSAHVPSQRFPGVKKECPHYGKTHGGSDAEVATTRSRIVRDFSRESSAERQPQQQ
ncbi:hypothetical protein Taro_004970, partial [Colocasia esculenta]|nr:hypothetical protein [Colocasia esculenta]